MGLYFWAEPEDATGVLGVYEIGSVKQLPMAEKSKCSVALGCDRPTAALKELRRVITENMC
jgi:hypothetical protein